MKTYLLLLLAVLFIGAALAVTSPTTAPSAEGTSTDYSIDVAGTQRTYRLHVPGDLPADKPVPLVLVFHGGSGRGRQIERMTKFSPLADREHFLVAYPDGLETHWNDGRNSTARAADDVTFVDQLIDDVEKTHSVDPKRIFATGISNGAIFSHYLAARLSGRIAAIAPVSGGIAKDYEPKFAPAEPVSVFIINGDADPLVPIGGGEIPLGRGGAVIARSKAAADWVKVDACQPAKKAVDLPNTDPTDGCTVSFQRYPGGKNKTEVWVYTIHGGGHTWPDGPQYLPKFLIGRVCRDFDATETIWQFFKTHPKQ